MWRAMAAGCLAMALAGCMPAGFGADSAGGAPRLVPDPAFRPVAGDLAVLHGPAGGPLMESMPLLKDMTSFDIFERLNQAGSAQELSDLEARKHLQWTPRGTRVMVLSVRDRSLTGSRVAAEVRVLDGPFKDQAGWVPLEHVARLKPAPTEE